MIEGARMNLYPAGLEEAGIPAPVNHHVNKTVGEYPRYVVSWYWREWVPKPWRWWYRLLPWRPFEYGWVRYELRVDYWDEACLEQILQARPVMWVQVEELERPPVYVSTKPTPAQEGREVT